MKLYVTLIIAFLFLAIPQISFAASDYSVQSSATASIQNETEIELELNKLFSRQTSERKLFQISSFAISENGMIAVCDDRFSKSINIYNSQGKFLYGYNCNIDGSFGVEYQDDKMMVYILRLSAVIVLDGNAEMSRAYEFNQSRENLDYWHNSVLSIVKANTDGTYALKRSFLSVFYSKIEKVNNHTERSTIIVDYGNYGIILTLVIILVFVVVSVLVAVRLIKLIKQR